MADAATTTAAAPPAADTSKAAQVQGDEGDNDDATDIGTDDSNNDEAGKDDEADAAEAAKQLKALQVELDKLKSEHERLLQIARKADQRAKSNDERAKANAAAATELERIKREGMSDMERAITDAKNEARAEALREFGSQLVDAEFRAAAAGRFEAEQLEVFVSGIDLTRFLDEGGKVKREDVATFVDAIAPAKPEPPKPQRKSGTTDEGGNNGGDIGQGAGRGNAPAALNDDALLRAVEMKLGVARR